MSKIIALRDAYGDALAELGRVNSKVVVLDADVSSSSKSGVFGKEFPERFFNIGISELDMNSMASGMATCGLIPFTNTFAVFMTMRGGDPINSFMGYDKLNVKLAGTYAGLSDSYDGASHHGTADIAIIQAIPNITILSPCDAVETKKAVFAAAELDGPVYLRLSRAGMPVIMEESYAYKPGKGVVLRQGTDVTLVATGYMVHKALEAADLLAKDGISARVVNIHTIKPLDEELIIACAKETGCIVTAEEHSVYGGLGSTVAACVAKHHPVPMELVGTTTYAESGDYEELLIKYGLNGTAIAEKTRHAIRLK